MTEIGTLALSQSTVSVDQRGARLVPHRGGPGVEPVGVSQQEAWTHAALALELQQTT